MSFRVITTHQSYDAGYENPMTTAKRHEEKLNLINSDNVLDIKHEVITVSTDRYLVYTSFLTLRNTL